MAEAKKASSKKPEGRKSFISRSAIVKIAKKNGAERIGKDAIIKLVEVTEKYVAEVTKKSIGAAAHANRKSVRGEDVAFVTQ